MPEDHFDAWIATRYQRLWPHLFDPAVVDPAVDFLAGLAGTGPVLEFGIGTGRLALPLSRRGVRVHGIELSSAMIAELARHDDAASVDVTLGDFATTKLEPAFSLVYLVRNTIMNLTSQGEQVACFRNAAAHLGEGGCFVIETAVPPWQRLPPGERICAFDVTPEHVGLDEIDVATQRSWSHHYWFLDGDARTFSAPFRYVWPSELDLMAQLAGMTLRERWADWTRAPFTSDSASHVSVWARSVSDRTGVTK
jgi:SAM-dependent methyltransferase